MTAILKYDVACRALAEASTIDEVKDIRDKAEAMRIYARQAKNTELEERAAVIRLRGEHRLGEMLIEAKNAGRLRAGQPRKKNGAETEPIERIVLEDFGIDKKLSSRAQKLASTSAEVYQATELRLAESIRNRNIPTVNGARAIMGSRQEPDDSLDYFPTPPWATRALMQHVLPGCGFAGKRLGATWEPACGEGHIAEILAEHSDQVLATDIHDYGYGVALQDFLRVKGEAFWGDWIITNPPFGEKTEQFVLRAIDLASVGVAMFVRLQWLESVGRYEAIFRDHPPTMIAFFAERVNLCKGRWEPEGSTATAYIWLVWVKGAKALAPFWIPPGQREALTRPDDAARFTAHPVIRKADFNPETGEIAESLMGPVDTPPALSEIPIGAWAEKSAPSRPWVIIYGATVTAHDSHNRSASMT